MKYHFNYFPQETPAVKYEVKVRLQEKKMRFVSLFLLALLAMIPFVHAQEVPAPAAQAQNDDATYTQRLELAKKMHEIRPTRDQVDAAIEQAAQGQMPADREAFKTAMHNILNYKAIEKISVDAMTQVYTLPELQAMVDYYSKPEAKSAAAKEDQYEKLVYPEIIRMLDQAMMRIRTGGVTTPGNSFPADQAPSSPSGSP